MIHPFRHKEQIEYRDDVDRLIAFANLKKNEAFRTVFLFHEVHSGQIRNLKIGVRTITFYFLPSFFARNQQFFQLKGEGFRHPIENLIGHYI